MKKLIIILILLLTAAVYNKTLAQSFKEYYQGPTSTSVQSKYVLEVGIQTNRSIRGWRNGWNIDLALFNKFRIGYFNTTAAGNAENIKRSDKGVETSFMFNSKGRFNVGPQVKVTLTDGRFISVIPMIQTRLAISKRLMFKAGAGMSDRYPIFDGGLAYRIR